jgi:AraC-like DNA-binding protein
MGFSAKQYIQNKVMDEAKRLLVYTNFPISDIAFELCFSTVSYFIRSFRQHTGETPLHYRKTNKPEKVLFSPFFLLRRISSISLLSHQIITNNKK